MTEPTTPLVLEYQLTEEDIHRYCLAGRPGKCWRSCRRRKTAMLFLFILGLFLVGICYQERGLRSAGLAFGTTALIVAVMTWTRQARIDGRICLVARQMGLPEDFRLTVTDDGIIEEPGENSSDPGRRFSWSEVNKLEHIDGLTVFRLRQGGCLLFVPDRAFSTLEARLRFADQARSWWTSSVREPLKMSARPGSRG